MLGALVLTGCLSLVPSTGAAFGIKPPTDIKRPPTPTPVPSPAATPRPSATPTPSATPIRVPASSDFKAYWDGKHKDSSLWTTYVQDAVSRIGQDLVKGPSDIATFCPQYDRLGTQDRVNFWVQLVAAMTKYESGFNPASRMVETTMGHDPVTGAPTSSEGLMQLSYSDEKNYKAVLPVGVCDFDYPTDKKLASTDVRRTILDPKTNLTCAIGILNRQVQRTGKLAIGSGAYWAVIKTDRASNKLAPIRAITKSLAFCN